MKVTKRITPVLFALFLFLGIPVPEAGAEEIVQDGLRIEMTSDPDKTDDSFTLSLSVANENDFPVLNVSVNEIIPDGFSIVSGDKSEKKADTLGPGETLILKSVCSANENVSEKVKTTETAVSETVQETVIINDIIQKKEISVEPYHISTGKKIAACIAAVLLVTVTVIIVVRKRKKSDSGKMLSLIIAAAAAGSFTGKTVLYAAEYVQRTAEISVQSGLENIFVTAEISYDTDISADEDEYAGAEEYYENNSEELIEVKEAEKDSDDVLTEAQAIKMFRERGFTVYPVFYEYSIEGEYLGETEASENSDTRHPMYMTYYMSPEGEYWSLFIIGNTIAANPVSYNLESEMDAQTLFSETETLQSYDDETNMFYVTVPKESAVILKVVKRIDSDTLNQLNVEGIKKYE